MIGTYLTGFAGSFGLFAGVSMTLAEAASGSAFTRADQTMLPVGLVITGAVAFAAFVWRVARKVEQMEARSRLAERDSRLAISLALHAMGKSPKHLDTVQLARLFDQARERSRHEGGESDQENG